MLWEAGVNRGGADSTVFMQEVHVPYQENLLTSGIAETADRKSLQLLRTNSLGAGSLVKDFDIDMTRIEKVTATVATA